MRNTLSFTKPEYSKLRLCFLPEDVDLAYPEKTGFVRVTLPPRS